MIGSGIPKSHSNPPRSIIASYVSENIPNTGLLVSETHRAGKGMHIGGIHARSAPAAILRESHAQRAGLRDTARGFEGPPLSACRRDQRGWVPARPACGRSSRSRKPLGFDRHRWQASRIPDRPRISTGLRRRRTRVDAAGRSYAGDQGPVLFRFASTLAELGRADLSTANDSDLDTACRFR